MKQAVYFGVVGYAILLVATGAAQVQSATGGIYRDPQGRSSVRVLSGWQAAGNGDGAALAHGNAQVISYQGNSQAGYEPGYEQQSLGGRVITSFQRVSADDLTFSVDIPAGWRKAGPANYESAGFNSQQGESFGVGQFQVYSNQFVLETNLRAYQPLLPPQQLMLMSRLLAPPLNAQQIVGELFPKIANGAIQNMHIATSVPLSSQYGVSMTLIYYQYIFVPSRDAAFTSMANPVLQDRSQVPMEAAAIITTYPGSQDGITWRFGLVQISAPQATWARNQANYARIFRSFQLNAQALAVKAKNNAATQALANQMHETTTKVGKNWVCILGETGPWWQNIRTGECVCPVRPEPHSEWGPGCPTDHNLIP